eukprot:1158082-Pelagomonas_calceolata.AAC.6
MHEGIVTAPSPRGKLVKHTVDLREGPALQARKIRWHTQNALQHGKYMRPDDKEGMMDASRHVAPYAGPCGTSEACSTI